MFFISVHPLRRLRWSCQHWYQLYVLHHHCNLYLLTLIQTTACWALVFLASNPEWKKQVKAEIDALIAKHTDTVSRDPLHKRLAAIPISAWEDEMPVLDVVIRETIRLILTGTALRRNLIEELTVSSGTIRKGDFVAYLVADAHLNPEIYKRPEEFDPARFGPGREEDKKSTFAYLGWGAGGSISFFLDDVSFRDVF